MLSSNRHAIIDGSLEQDLWNHGASKALPRRKLLQALHYSFSNSCTSGDGEIGRPDQGLPQASGRPRTAPRVAKPLSRITFPGKLQLRGPNEAAALPSQWAAPRGDLVFPLERQSVVRQLVEECGAEHLEVTNGSHLSAWVMNARECDAAPLVMEPLAASRVDRSLAVEPIEFIIHQPLKTSRSLHYGEPFRFKAANSDLYLCHGGDEGGLRWERFAGKGSCPHNLRFAAHGGELGAPLLFGRSLKLQRVRSPAPSSESESETESSDSESEQHRHCRRQQLTSAKRVAPASEATCSQTLPAPSCEIPGPLISRLGDTCEMLDVALLPVRHHQSRGKESMWFSESDEEEIDAASNEARYCSLT